MVDITQKIRQTLETKLSTISGIPPIAYENTKYEPTIGVSYIECRLVPTWRKPAHLGLTPQKLYRGLFLVNCYVPQDKGTSEADTLAAKVLEAFEGTTDIVGTDIIVRIRDAEREQGMEEGSWYVVPVLISWYIYN